MIFIVYVDENKIKRLGFNFYGGTQARSRERYMS